MPGWFDVPFSFRPYVHSTPFSPMLRVSGRIVGLGANTVINSICIWFSKFKIHPILVFDSFAMAEAEPAVKQNCDKWKISLIIRQIFIPTFGLMRPHLAVSSATLTGKPSYVFLLTNTPPPPEPLSTGVTLDTLLFSVRESTFMKTDINILVPIFFRINFFQREKWVPRVTT